MVPLTAIQDEAFIDYGQKSLLWYPMRHFALGCPLLQRLKWIVASYGAHLQIDHPSYTAHSDPLPLDDKKRLEQDSLTPAELQKWPEDIHYSVDGSYDPVTELAGSAVLHKSGAVWISAPPGQQSPYRAELWALLIAARRAIAGMVIACDCRGAVLAATSKYRKLRHSDILAPLRELVTGKSLVLRWVKAHVGTPHNEQADQKAKKAAASISIPRTRLPVTRPGQIVYKNNLYEAFPKQFTRESWPKHRHNGIAAVSWKVLRRRKISQWDQWTFGCKWWPGYLVANRDWFEETKGLSSVRCLRCGTMHPGTVIGAEAACPRSVLFPQVLACWSKTFGSTFTLWLMKSTGHDKRVLMRCLVPTTLWGAVCGDFGAKTAFAKLLQTHNLLEEHVVLAKKPSTVPLSVDFKRFRHQRRSIFQYVGSMATRDDTTGLSFNSVLPRDKRSKPWPVQKQPKKKPKVSVKFPPPGQQSIFFPGTRTRSPPPDEPKTKKTKG